MRGNLCLRLQTLLVGIGHSALGKRRWRFLASIRRGRQCRDDAALRHPRHLWWDPHVYVAKQEEKQITSERLVVALVAIEGHPWAEFGRMRNPLTKNSLARLLKPYKIRPGTIRIGPGRERHCQGVQASEFADVFARYLPALYCQNQTLGSGLRPLATSS